MEIRIPTHAQPFLNGSNGYDWSKAVAHPPESTLKGLQFGNIFEFDSIPALVFTADADIDTDGSGGSRAVDPWWLPETSLRSSAGRSLDSMSFPGIVIPSGIRALGARLGDFGVVIWGGIVASAQIYDFGPKDKTGELSVFLARVLGLVPPNVTDRHAASNAPDVTDVVYVLYPESGPGHALETSLIGAAVGGIYRRASGVVPFATPENARV